MLDQLPTTTPIDKAIANQYRESPPKNINAISGSNVVPLVYKVRESVEETAKSIRWLRVNFSEELLNSRILSKTTTVSFTEYPEIVNNATANKLLTSKLIVNPSQAKVPQTIIKSWNKATIARVDNWRSNL